MHEVFLLYWWACIDDSTISVMVTIARYVEITTIHGIRNIVKKNIT